MTFEEWHRLVRALGETSGGSGKAWVEASGKQQKWGKRFHSFFIFVKHQFHKLFPFYTSLFMQI